MTQNGRMLRGRSDLGFDHPVVAVVVLVLVTTTCGGERDEVGSEVRFGEWDSAGVRLVQSSSQVLRKALPWVVDTVPSLEIGQVEGEGPSQFHRIRGLLSRSNGELIVIDSGSQELRWFDRSGVHRRSLGRGGQGPGEFENPLLVPQFHGDSLLVFDTRLRRFTWVAKDGSGFRAYGPVNGSGQLIAGAATAAAGTRVLFRSASGDCLMKDYCESSLFVRWVDPVRGISDTIAEFPRQSVRTTELTDVPHVINGPFEPIGVAAVGPRGPVVGGGTEFELREYDAAGHLTSIFRVAVAAREVTDEDLERVVEGYAVGGYDSEIMRRVFARMNLPEVLPAFESLVVDRVGWYWAELFRLDVDPSAWLVFDEEGRARGVVNLPENVEIHEIGADYILGRWVDDLGVEYVRRYGLSRGSQ